jgi:putative peptidoglycan lipid II flippase
MMLPTVIIFGISGLVMGMLNAHQVFLLPALAPAAYSLGIILGVWLLPASLGIDRLAIGTLIGAGGHLLLQLPALFRLPERSYQLAAGFRDEAVRKVLRLMLPRVFGAGIVQLNFVANTIISLSLGAGSASALIWAFTLMLMPQAAIAQSTGTASLPTLSAQVELGKRDDFRQTLSGIMRVMLLLALPATVGLALLRVPLVRVLYEHGNFDATSTQMVAWALLWYALGLTGHSLVEVLSRAYYAMHDTKTPVLVGVAAMTGNILLSFLFSRLFSRIGWLPLGGLALANTTATAVESLALMLIMRRRIGGIDGRQILRTGFRALAASGVMGSALFVWMTLFGNRNKFLVLSIGVVLGLGVYALMLWLLKVPEARELVRRVKRKLAQKG